LYAICPNVDYFTENRREGMLFNEEVTNTLETAPPTTSMEANVDRKEVTTRKFFSQYRFNNKGTSIPDKGPPLQRK
jgi:hypothetical protein